ncbi:MAG: DUF423 domain-containing protein [Pseudomonadota bacterium]
MSWATLMIRSGAVLGALGVLAGAFGAHGLEGQVSAERLDTFATGASYHLWHALALVLTGVVARQRSPRASLMAAGVCFAVGVVLFSGSLYALVLLDAPMLGMITPLGGLTLVAGWLLLAFGVGGDSDA